MFAALLSMLYRDDFCRKVYWIPFFPPLAKNHRDDRCLHLLFFLFRSKLLHLLFSMADGAMSKKAFEKITSHMCIPPH